MFDNKRKNKPKYFFLLEGLPSFRKLVFPTDFCILKKWSYILYHNCQNTSWSLTRSYSVSGKMGNIRKSLPEFFFGTVAFILKNLVLDFLGPKEMKIKLAQYLLKHLVYPHNLFPDMEMLPFFSKTCVFNNLLGVTEINFYFPQQLSEYLLDPQKLSPKVCHNR